MVRMDAHVVWYGMVWMDGHLPPTIHPTISFAPCTLLRNPGEVRLSKQASAFAISGPTTINPLEPFSDEVTGSLHFQSMSILFKRAMPSVESEGQATEIAYVVAKVTPPSDCFPAGLPYLFTLPIKNTHRA